MLTHGVAGALSGAVGGGRRSCAPLLPIYWGGSSGVQPVQRECDEQGRPPAWPMLGPDAALVRRHNLPADGQPQPRPPGSRLSPTRLDKLVKDCGQFSLRDPHATIVHTDHDGRRVLVQAELDAAAVR